MTSKIRVSGKGLAQTSYGGRDLDDPPTLLRLPVRAGESREVKAVGRIPGYLCTVAGEEEVRVPAGTFKAVRIDSEVTIDGAAVKLSAWYAPGGGLVKKATDAGGPEWTQALKSFTPGK